MNQTVFHYEEKYLLLTPVIKLKGGVKNLKKKKKKSEERERWCETQTIIQTTANARESVS